MFTVVPPAQSLAFRLGAAYIWHPVPGGLQADGGTILFQGGDLIAKRLLAFD